MGWKENIPDYNLLGNIITGLMLSQMIINNFISSSVESILFFNISFMKHNINL